MTRKNKIRALSGLFIVFAVGMGIVALRPLFYAAKVFITRHNSPNATKNNTFETVDVAIYDAKDQKINVSAYQVTKNKNENVLLKRMTSTFSLENKEVCNVTADTAKTINERHVDFRGNVQLQTSSGISLLTNHALVDLTKKTASGKTHVSIRKKNGEISGDDYFIDLKKKHLIIKQNAKTSSETENIKADRMVIKLKEGNKVGSAEVIGNVIYDSSRYTTSATRMTLYGNLLKLSQNVHIVEKAKNGHIYGNDVLVYLNSDNKITSVEVVENAKYLSPGKSLQARKIIYDGKVVTAQGDVVLDYSHNKQKYRITSSSLNAKISNGNISQIESKSKLIIRANGDIIRADSGVVRNNKLFLYGNVSASGSAGNVLGDRAELDLATGDIDIQNSSGIVEEGCNAK